MKLFKKIKAYFRYQNAVRQADEAHAQDGERYYVLPTGNGELMVINRNNIRILKKKHYIKKGKTMMDVCMGAYYYTPYRDGHGEMPVSLQEERKDRYYEYALRH